MRSPRRSKSTQPTKASNAPDAGGTMNTLCLSLDELDNQLSLYVRQGGMMIYWNHGLSHFSYLIAEDNAQYKQEIKNMRKLFREGEIVDLKAGEEYETNGTVLHPLDMKFRNMPCHAYMLLRRNGSFADAEYTPYFFKSKTKRDEVLAWMQRSRAST